MNASCNSSQFEEEKSFLDGTYVDLSSPREEDKQRNQDMAELQNEINDVQNDLE